MGIFDMSWFKSRRKKEQEDALMALDIERKMIENELLLNEADDEKKVYKNIKLVDNTLIVTLIDGSILTKPNATINDFIKARTSKNEYDLIGVIADVENNKEKEEDRGVEEKQERIYNGARLLTSISEFEMNEEAVYMSGIPRSLPPLLVNRFAEIISKYSCSKGNIEDYLENDVDYTSLKKFWLKCCLNPNARSAEDLYDFLTHHKMKIDKHGNFYAYRRVKSVKGKCKDSELVDAISNAYNKVKAVWKKSPKDFEMFRIETGDNREVYELKPCGSFKNQEHIANSIGNLHSLYLALPYMQENRYTDAHTRTMDYRVGEIASIPRNECDDNNGVSCSRGLHIASKRYDYSGFGDTPILAIVNPMDVVAVPNGEVGKMRCSRWFFAMTLDEGEQYILDEDDFDVTELGDIFEEKCLKGMEQHAHKSFAEEVKRHTFTIPSMSNTQIKDIVKTLDDMHNVIKNRVVRK